MTSDTVLVLEMLDARRSKKGAHWCQKHLVGRMRSQLERPLVATPINGSFAEARMQAATILRAHCIACGRCELGRT